MAQIRCFEAAEALHDCTRERAKDLYWIIMSLIMDSEDSKARELRESLLSTFREIRTWAWKALVALKDGHIAVADDILSAIWVNLYNFEILQDAKR